jgi:hypothetical protein
MQLPDFVPQFTDGLGIVKSFRPVNDKTLYLVQEAHGRPDVAETLAALAAHLYDKQAVRDFLLEGLFQRMDARELRAQRFRFPQPLENLKSSVLKPTEYLALATDREFTNHPADDEDAYNEQAESQRACWECAEQLAPAFAAIRNLFNSYWPHVLAPDWLRMHDLATRSERNEAIGVADVRQELMNLSRKLGLDLVGLQQVRRFEELEALEKEIPTSEKVSGDFARLLGDVAALLRAPDADPADDTIVATVAWQLARERRLPGEVRYLHDDEIFAAYSRGRNGLLAEMTVWLKDHKIPEPRDVLGLALAMGLDIEPYPALQAYVRLISLQKTMVQSFEASLRSLKYLGEHLLRQHPARDELWPAMTLEWDLIRFERLVRAEALPDDLGIVQRLIEAYAFDHVMARLRETDSVAADELKDVGRTWDMARYRALRFYRYAAARQAEMARRIKDLFQGSTNRVALLCGGFHAPRVLRELHRQRTCSTVVIAPRIEDPHSGSDYQQVMTRQRER